MSIKFAITGRSPVSIADEHISVGSDPCCAIVFTEDSSIKPIHAVIKEISGRWLVEAADTEPLRVGNSEPGKRHWLKPGDVIHLSQQTSITFQPPEDDDFLPDVAKFADTGTAPTKREALQSLLKDDIPLSDTADMIEPVTSTAIPTFKAGLPESKSGEQRTRQPVQPKRPPSGTIKSVPTAKEPATNKSPSNSEIPVRRRTRPAGSSGQIPTRKPDDDEISPDVPVLTRMNSWDVEELAPAPRRGRSKDKEEMEWIMKMIFRCVGIGVALLIFLIVVSSIWKALSQPEAGLPTASETTSVDAASATATPVITVPATTTIPRPKPTQTTASNEPTKNAPESTADRSDEPSASEDLDATDEMPTESEPASDEPEPEMVGSDEQAIKPENSHEPLTPVLQATTESLYAVVMRDSMGNEQVHLGTAWAASDRHLVTTATIAVAIKGLQKQGYTPAAFQPSSDWAIRIKGIHIHPKYSKAAAEADEAKESQNEKRLAQAQTIQVRHDLAVLDVDPTNHLENPLPVITRPLKTTTETVYSMVGFPLVNREGKPPLFSEVGDLEECNSRRLAPIGLKRSKEPILTIKFPPVVTERNWSGSPVLNKDNQVVGVYAQLPSIDGGSGKKDIHEPAVVWLGLLREVAADVVRKSESKDKNDDDDM